jgi:demethylmenaquinone methyltransferase/2-methoxy-6-polyprenyl-1,4-benzoquinol methylase
MALAPGAGAPAIRRMFDAVAPRYDLLNRILSGGIDRRWRRALAAAVVGDNPAGGRYLDLATGTGDCLAALRARDATARVAGVDLSGEMLRRARPKNPDTALLVADAVALPFADAAFDGATVAFGVRNMPDRLAALRELARIVRRGGRVAVLELVEPASPLARLYVHHLVPRMAAVLAGRAAPAYRYLEESIAAFPEPPAFARTMGAAGLRAVTFRRLFPGACALFVGARP